MSCPLKDFNLSLTSNKLADVGLSGVKVKNSIVDELTNQYKNYIQNDVKKYSECYIQNTLPKDIKNGKYDNLINTLSEKIIDKISFDKIEKKL